MSGDPSTAKGPAVIPYVIHDGSLDLAALSGRARDQSLHMLGWAERHRPPDGARVLLYLDDRGIRELVPVALDRQWELGLLPHPGAEQAGRALGVRGDTAAAFAAYRNTDAIDADVLTCNGEVVFAAVTIGEVLTLTQYAPEQRPALFNRLQSALRGIRRMRLRDYRLTTAKGQQYRLAVLGLVAMEHTQSSLLGRAFSDALSLSDGHLTLLAFAPRSRVAYLGFLLRLLMPGKISLGRLPPQVGLLHSSRLRVEAQGGVDYRLDGSPAHAEQIDLRILDRTLRLLPGAALRPRQDQPTGRDKVKIGRVPTGEAATQLAGKLLPFFDRAAEEEYRELFASLRDSATLSSPFLVLMVLSTLLALTGLYADSAPVIIGAMILAPLMGPILGLAMGLVRIDYGLLRTASRTLAIGIAAALGGAVLVARLIPLENLTGEMQARLTPTLLDLSVAIISGIAAAYAFVRREVGGSLAGVAIAVALVPPLSTAGIGLGWGNWAMAGGAALLFATNLVGIALAAGATFLVMGFAPFVLARRGIAIGVVLAAIVAAPLTVAFVNLVEEGYIEHGIDAGQRTLAGDPVWLRVIDVSNGSPPVVRVQLSAKQVLGERHVAALKEELTRKFGKEVQVDAQLNLRL